MFKPHAEAYHNRLREIAAQMERVHHDLVNAKHEVPPEIPAAMACLEEAQRHFHGLAANPVPVVATGTPLVPSGDFDRDS